MFLSEWREFPSAPCVAGKKNLMTARVSMLLKSRASPDMLPFSLCNKKSLQVGTWTGPSFQRHYRFRPTISGSRSGQGLISTPSHCSRREFFFSPRTGEMMPIGLSECFISKNIDWSSINLFFGCARLTLKHSGWFNCDSCWSCLYFCLFEI